MVSPSHALPENASSRTQTGSVDEQQLTQADTMVEPTNAITLHEAASDEQQRELVHKLLAELLITIADKSFENQTLYIDGYRFINCRFTKCNLVALRGTFEFHHCFIVEGTRAFNEGAMKSIQFYTLWRPTMEVSSAFRAILHPDGSFSVAKGASMK
jgi:hypothetical protein